MNSKQIDKYVMELLPLLSKLDSEQLRVPADGAYYDDVVSGMQVLVPDLAKNKAALSDMIFR